MITTTLSLALFGASIVGVLLEIAGTYHNTAPPTKNSVYRLVLFVTLGGLAWLFRAMT